MARSPLPGIPAIIILQIILAPFHALSQTKPRVIPLWENGAPGFENRRNEPELAKDYWVKNIHNPSITVFLPPKEKATGVAVVICPGGGHRELVYNAEGVEPAVFLNSNRFPIHTIAYFPDDRNCRYL